MLKKILAILFSIVIIAISLYFLLSTPQKLKNIPKADKIGLVTSVYKINIAGINNPINSGIIEYEDHDYLLTFRIQQAKEDYIGLVELDKNFKQKKPYKKINLNSNHAQDARIFQLNNEYFLIYNDTLYVKDFTYRAMHLASLNKKKWEVNYITCLDLNIKPSEKNWVPFSCLNEKGEEKLLLAYDLLPHKIMELQDLKQNSLKHYAYPNNPCFTRFHWDYGVPRGGTPARLINGEYLSFFHSSFDHMKKRWYVMGAYTFQAKPPYKITRVSKYPIVFGDISATRIVFPVGFACGTENGKEVFYVSYGENDSFSKIVTIDKAKLFESLKTLD